MLPKHVAVAALACGLSASPAFASYPPGFAETTIVGGLSLPTSAVFTPDGRLLVTEKAGAIRIVSGGMLLPTPAATIAVTNNSERGLLGLALDPQFASNGLVYVYYTTSAGSFQPPGHPFGTPKNRVSRFTMGGNTISLASEIVILDDIPSDAGNHNAGGVAFGPDGKLYISTGDGGSTPSQAQQLGNLAGKILRLNHDGTIPSDNPFVSTTGARGEIWCYGLRNPWRFAWDEAGRLFIGDVGSNVFEEINLGLAGANYGWPVREGIAGDPAYTDPIYAYPHGSGASITMGVFSRSPAYPSSLQGVLFFGDFVQGFIRTLQYSSAGATVNGFATGAPSPVHFVNGPDGRLHYVAIGTGEVRRVDYLGSRLTVSVNGLGSIFSTPAGVACGADCIEDYEPSVTVGLSPAPASGYEFAGFSGDDACRTGSVDMSSSRTCMAWFVPVPAGAGRAGRLGDYDRDGRTDLTAWRPSTGDWWIFHGSSGEERYTRRGWGALGDVPVPGDYDGDGAADIAVWRPATGVWWILTSSSGFLQYFTRGWGESDFTAVPGDYDGDGITDIAVWRPSTGVWWILTSASGFTSYFTRGWGGPGFRAVPGDYDGDSRTDIAVWRPSTGIWWILRSSSDFSSYFTVGWGDESFEPVQADYDGDGRTDVAVWRPSTGAWWILTSSSGFAGYFQVGWGDSGFRAVVGDFDGDGRSDPAVWKESTGVWWILRSSTQYQTFFTKGWGTAGDVPVAAR
jgi:glucose/arabinose dehydrogenase